MGTTQLTDRLQPTTWAEVQRLSPCHTVIADLPSHPQLSLMPSSTTSEMVKFPCLASTFTSLKYWITSGNPTDKLRKKNEKEEPNLVFPVVSSPRLGGVNKGHLFFFLLHPGLIRNYHLDTGTHWLLIIWTMGNNVKNGAIGEARIYSPLVNCTPSHRSAPGARSLSLSFFFRLSTPRERGGKNESERGRENWQEDRKREKKSWKAWEKVESGTSSRRYESSKSGKFRKFGGREGGKEGRKEGRKRGSGAHYIVASQSSKHNSFDNDMVVLKCHKNGVLACTVMCNSELGRAESFESRACSSQL